MDLTLTPVQQDLVERTRHYATTVLRPAAARLDALSDLAEFPFDLMRPGFELGLPRLPLPPELGGIGADPLTLALVIEEVAAGDISAGYFFRHYWRFARVIPRLPAALRASVLDRLHSDVTFVPASASTEPQAGSDNALPYDVPGHGAMLSARRDGEHWVLNGTKAMITNGALASLYFVFARTDPTVGIRRGTTMFAVPADTPGVSTGPLYRKLGQRGSPQADVHLSDVRLPADHALTAVGEGFAASERALISANVTGAAMAIGVARAAYERALDFCLDRVQGGMPIYRHQLVARDLGEMRMRLDAARSFLLRAAFELGSPETFDPELSWGVRVFATEAAIAVTQTAMFLLGGRGIMVEHGVEKLVRDALTLTHGNGTNPLMLVRSGTRQAERRLAERGS